MAGKIKYDLDKFRELVKAKMPLKEIREVMGITNNTTLDRLKLKLFEADGKVYKIDSGKNVAQGLVAVGKRGNVAISPKILEGAGFNSGDKFQVTITKHRITLTLQNDGSVKDL